LSEDLLSLMGDAESSDVTLIVGDQELACHKAILMTRSIYFRALLSGGFQESGKARYEIEEPFDLFQLIMKFLYDGTIRDEDLTPVCLDLIPMADQYLVQGLKAACELLACSEDVVTSSNVLDALLVAHRSNCDTLFRFCVPIFTASKSALMGSEKWQELKQLDFVERLLAADPSFSIPDIEDLKDMSERETSSKLKSDMANLLEQEVVPFDATVKGKDGSVRVHQVVLSARSKLFRKRFKNHGPEVVLPGRVEVTKQIVRFCYSARLPEAKQQESLAVEMPLLAAQFGDEDEVPIKPYTRFAHFAISAENVFLQAVAFNCADLVRFCRPIIVANRSSLALEPAAWKKLKKNRQALMLLW